MTTMTRTNGGRIDLIEAEADRRKGLGDFLLAVVASGERAAPPATQDAAHERLERIYKSKRSLVATSGTAGGWLLPTSMTLDLLRSAAETAIVRPRATVVPMDAVQVDLPMLDATTPQSAGTPPWFGGFAPNWAADGAAIPESDMRFKSAKLSANALTAYFEVSATMLRSAAAGLEVMLRRVIGDAVAYVEDRAFLTRVTPGAPLGILAADCLATTAARGSATAITDGNRRSMRAKCLPVSRSRAAFVVSTAVEDEFLADARTTEFLDPTTGRVRQFLGKNEVLTTDKTPGLNSLGDVLLADLAYYVIGDALSMEISVSDHYKFRTNQVAFRLVHLVAGMPWFNDEITLIDGTTTVSPFVALGVQ